MNLGKDLTRIRLQDVSKFLVATALPKGKKILVVPADFHPSFLPFSCIMNLHQFKPFEVLPGFERGLWF